MLSKAEALFAYDHADDRLKRQIVETLLDRITSVESELQTTLALLYGGPPPNEEVETFLDRVKTVVAAANRKPDPSVNTTAES